MGETWKELSKEFWEKLEHLGKSLTLILGGTLKHLREIPEITTGKISRRNKEKFWKIVWKSYCRNLEKNCWKAIPENYQEKSLDFWKTARVKLWEHSRNTSGRHHEKYSYVKNSCRNPAGRSNSRKSRKEYQKTNLRRNSGRLISEWMKFSMKIPK